MLSQRRQRRCFPPPPHPTTNTGGGPAAAAAHAGSVRKPRAGHLLLLPRLPRKQILLRQLGIPAGVRAEILQPIHGGEEPVGRPGEAVGLGHDAVSAAIAGGVCDYAEHHVRGAEGRCVREPSAVLCG